MIPPELTHLPKIETEFFEFGRVVFEPRPNLVELAEVRFSNWCVEQVFEDLYSHMGHRQIFQHNKVEPTQSLYILGLAHMRSEIRQDESYGLMYSRTRPNSNTEICIVDLNQIKKYTPLEVKVKQEAPVSV